LEYIYEQQKTQILMKHDQKANDDIVRDDESSN